MNSTVAMAVPNVTCHIAGNPDIVGIGVRVAIFVPAMTAAFLCAFIDSVKLDEFLFLLKSCMGISIRLIFGAVIYSFNNTLTQYHTYMILHLGFMNSPASCATWIWIIRALAAQRRFRWKQSTTTIYYGSYVFTMFMFAVGIIWDPWAQYSAVQAAQDISALDISYERNLACEISLASGEAMIYEKVMLTFLVLNSFVTLVVMAALLAKKFVTQRTEMRAAAGEGLVGDATEEVDEKILLWCLVWISPGRFSFIAFRCLVIAIPIVSFVLIKVTEDRNQSLIEQRGVENQWGFGQILVVLGLIGVYLELIYGCAVVIYENRNAKRRTMKTTADSDLECQNDNSDENVHSPRAKLTVEVPGDRTKAKFRRAGTI